MNDSDIEIIRDAVNFNPKNYYLLKNIIFHLAQAVEVSPINGSASEHHFREAFALTEEVADLQLKKNIDILYGSARMHYAWGRAISSSEIGGTHPRFKSQIETKMPGAKIVSPPKVIDMKRPDAWVQLDSELIPVEIKKDKFDRKALNQLLGYMRTYKAERGIASAPRLTVDIPDSIVFIEVSKS